jgi:hypothetical protein
MVYPVLFLFGLLAQTTNPPPQQPVSPAVGAHAAEPVVHEVAPGIFDYHGVRLDQKKRQISFPAEVNQKVGLIEYLLVNEKGKVHESLLATKIIPHDIHLALLLIGLQEDSTANANEAVPPQAIDTPYLQSAPKLKGPFVRISVAWTENGERKEVPADQWVFNLQSGKTMTAGPWTYNGSLVKDGAFLADQELSIVAVITDPTALVNNPREGYDNDEIWQANEKVIPPLDTPVDVIITIPEPTTKNQ